MTGDQSDLARFSPITDLVRRAFEWAKWLSPMQWLGIRWPLFRPRNALTPTEVASQDFTRRRARTIEQYLVCWLIIEVVFVGLACMGPWQSVVRLLVTMAIALRIVEIIQVTVNATLFDALSGRPDERVASRTRMIVLAGVNFCELWLCFGVIYAMNYGALIGAGRPVTAFYLSIITQLTIGYGDVHPTGWLRLVAATQGLSSLVFIVLVFGRFMASLPRVQGILDEDLTPKAAQQSFQRTPSAPRSGPLDSDVGPSTGQSIGGEDRTVEKIGNEKRKPCIRCCEPIHVDARVCHHCYRWQSRWAYDPYSPKAILISLGGLFLLLLGFFAFALFAQPDKEQIELGFQNSLTVVISETVPVKDPDGDYVAVLAKISNSSDLAWDHVYLQFDFKNNRGAIIDSWVDQDYDLVVPPSAEVRFRVARSAIRALSEYSDPTIEILSATRAGE